MEEEITKNGFTGFTCAAATMCTKQNNDRIDYRLGFGGVRIELFRLATDRAESGPDWRAVAVVVRRWQRVGGTELLPRYPRKLLREIHAILVSASAKIRTPCLVAGIAVDIRREARLVAFLGKLLSHVHLCHSSSSYLALIDQTLKITLKLFLQPMKSYLELFLLSSPICSWHRLEQQPVLERGNPCNIHDR